MRPGSHEALLQVWERGLELSQPLRALELLAWGWADEPPEQLAALRAGARNGRLAALRAALFGPQLALTAHCPACGALVELSLALADLTQIAAPPDQLRVEVDAYLLLACPPSAADLVDAAACGSQERAVALLRERALLAAECASRAVTLAELPQAALDALDAALEAADPLGNPCVAAVCPCCAHGWTAPLDLVAVLWEEIDAWARRTLGDVHALALAYGWSEAAILALSPRRRQTYLSMLTLFSASDT